MKPGGDTASIVFHRHRTVGVERHKNLVCVACQSFVDGVVHHLVNHMMQARAIVGVADVHARAFAHGIETFKHFNAVGTVGFGCFGPSRCFHKMHLVDRIPCGFFVTPLYSDPEVILHRATVETPRLTQEKTAPSAAPEAKRKRLFPCRSSTPARAMHQALQTTRSAVPDSR